MAWEHLLHLAVVSGSGTLATHLSHELRDGFLAFPLALVAVLGGLWLAQRLHLGPHPWQKLGGQGALISLAFALLLVPRQLCYTFVATGLQSFL